jgi:dienelactone hydrolase
MSDYDPFGRGPHPVGVRSTELRDPSRDRTVPVEVWYPATGDYAGQDLDDATRDTYDLMAGVSGSRQDAVRDADPAPGPWPAVVFSHGFAGHRRQTTHFCTHLASHGYAVAAPDHVGNTTADIMAMMAGGGAELTDPEAAGAYVRAVAANRPADARLVLDALLAGDLGVEARHDAVGMAGHSFGGWTTLQTTGQDDRIVAAVPLAPAGGRSAKNFGPIEHIVDELDLDWTRAVPTLMIVADDDSVLPLDGMHDLVERSPWIDRMVVLESADHFHFCDGVEVVHDLMAPLMGQGAKPSYELVPGSHAYDVTNGLGLAHFDAELRDLPEARELLARDPVEVLGERGIVVRVVKT